MRIAPIDIAHKEFSRKLSGLDPHEVFDFLRMVAEEMESVIKERNSLRESMRERELAIAEYKDKDAVLKKTLETATYMSDRIREDADREAKLIIRDAEQKAEMITKDARDSLRRVYQEITDLKKVRLQFESQIKGLAHAHLALIEDGSRWLGPTLETNQVPNTSIGNTGNV
jgi:cell division initiation protein